MTAITTVFHEPTLGPGLCTLPGCGRPQAAHIRPDQQVFACFLPISDHHCASCGAQYGNHRFAERRGYIDHTFEEVPK